MACQNDENFQDLLHCSICLEAFQSTGKMKPKMLPCQHSFCMACLHGISIGIKILCPLCRKQVEQAVDSLPNNLLLLQLIDAKGPAAPQNGEDDEPEPPDTESYITSLSQCYKMPGKVRTALKQYETAQPNIDFEAGHLSTVLKCMEYYEQMADGEQLDIVISCIQLVRNLLRKGQDKLLIFTRLTERVITVTLQTMNTFKRRVPIQVHGIDILGAVFSCLNDRKPSVCKVIMQSLNFDIGPEKQAKVVEMLAVLPRELSRKENAEIGTRANVKILLAMLEKKLQTQSYAVRLSSLLSTLMSLTDDTSSTSLNVVHEKGLNVLEKLFLINVPLETKSDALIVLSNLSEVPEVRREIIKHRSIINVLSQLMMSENRRVSFMSASVIAHLSSISKAEWTRLCGVHDFREDVLQKLYVQVSAWESAAPMNVKFRSFRPLYTLLQMYCSPPTQLFAAWTIRYFCLLDKNTYHEMLIKEQALETLLDLKDNKYADPNVRKFVDDILSSIH